MANKTIITITGNLVDDPELRFTPTGQAVCRFRVATNPRYRDRDTNEWKDGESLFLTCNVWRDQAENACESLRRGMRVILEGELRQRSYETKEGEKRTVYEVEVEEVAPSLRNAIARVTKVNRSQPAHDRFPAADASERDGTSEGTAAETSSDNREPAMAGAGSSPDF